MNTVTIPSFDSGTTSGTTTRPPGILSSVAPRGLMSVKDAGHQPRRFVMQSHPLGGPAASPRALLVAAALAVGIYLIGRRLSD